MNTALITAARDSFSFRHILIVWRSRQVLLIKFYDIDKSAGERGWSRTNTFYRSQVRQSRKTRISGFRYTICVPFLMKLERWWSDGLHTHDRYMRLTILLLSSGLTAYKRRHTLSIKLRHASTPSLSSFSFRAAIIYYRFVRFVWNDKSTTAHGCDNRIRTHE